MLTSLEFRLLATPKAAPELRHRLRDHGHDVRLCATELLTNVIDHLGEGTPVTVRVIGTAAEHGRVRVEVTDPAPDAPPVLRSAGGWEESGRGLALVDALAERWGVDLGPDRKTVWCELVGDGRADDRPVSGAARPTAPARGR